MIIITGATGTTGRPLVRSLVKAGMHVRAVTRDPEGARAIPGFEGAEVVHGDQALPETLGAAFSGGEKLFLLSSFDRHLVETETQMILTAKRAGIKHVVKLSVFAPQPDCPSDIVQNHLRVERVLEASGVAWTHLRPNSYMQNFFTYYFPVSQSRHRFQQCTGAGQMSLIDSRDISDVAAVVLTQQGHEGKVYDLTGPEPLSYAQVAARLSAVFEEDVRYEDMSMSAYVHFLHDRGLPDWGISTIAGLYGTAFREGRYAPVSTVVQDLTGKPARSIDDFARDHRAQFMAARG